MWEEFRKETDHPYSDFEAFERWMNTKTGPAMDYWQAVWSSMDTLERIGLYSIVCDVMSHATNENDIKKNYPQPI